MMYAMYSQEDTSQVHSKMSLETEVKRVWQKQESIESGGERCAQESQPSASSELVIDIQSPAEQSRRMGSRKAAASANFKKYALDSSEQLKFSMEESCNGLQELVIGVSTERKNSCEPIQESRTKLQSALVTGSESCRFALDKSTLQPVQETGYHASAKLVGTIELSSTLQTETCRYTMDESALQAAQETNYHASAKLVAGTIELSFTLQTESCRHTMDESALQAAQETNYHASAKLVAGTIELSSTLQTESCRHTMDESALQAAQETNYHASAKLVAGTIELSSVEDHYKGDPGS